MSIVSVELEDGEYVGYYLGKEVTRKSTLNRAMKALVGFVKGKQ